jgi:hypothetical protein
MIGYREWNKAIIEYFVGGLSSGETVYLSVDNDALRDISYRYFSSSEIGNDPIEQFQSAVRSRCVVGGQIDLEDIKGIGPDDLPRGVAFLAAMVLAAHWMAEEDDEGDRVSDTNYFTRLRDVLGFAGRGRPPGLHHPGVEEPFWETWNRWIIQRGWLPSAECGLDTVNRYINYPLSQSLLRAGDRERLEEVFRAEGKAGRLTQIWDVDRLGAWIRGRGSTLLSTRRHFRELIQEPEPKRYDAFLDAVYEVYSSIDWAHSSARVRHTHPFATQRRLTAGLYRHEDILLGTINYCLYPRQPRRSQKLADLCLIKNGQRYALVEERPGWFFPQPWPEDPSGGVLYQVQGDPLLEELVLPERGFWILVRDPQSAESGVFASWGQPGVGQTFLLLCRREYADQLQILRDESLLKWDHELALTEPYDGWVEYRECMVASQAWDGVLPQREDLYDALKPELLASITLAGGLRVKDQSGGGWLEGFEPEIRITSFDERLVRLKVTNMTDLGNPSFELEVTTNKAIPDLAPLTSGVYMLQATFSRSSKNIPPRTLRIIDWDSLDCDQPRQTFSVEWPGSSLRGAVIEANGRLEQKKSHD